MRREALVGLVLFALVLMFGVFGNVGCGLFVKEYKLASFVSGLNFPVQMRMAPGDGTRYYFAEREGVIRMSAGPNLEDQPFLEITDRVDASKGELGLKSFVFHPDYPREPLLFVMYTGGQSPDFTTVLSKFTVSEGRADPASEQVLLSLSMSSAFHNGGEIDFGPDGFLYVAIGEFTNSANSQDLTALPGKILRIDVNSGTPYAIPSDNPLTSDGVKKEIFAYGLRNSWRFAFDKETRELWAGDVGEDTFEEVNLISKGANYGWPIMEGSICFQSRDCSTSDLTLPVLEYPRSSGNSVIGGVVYRGSEMSELAGKFVFGDFGSGFLFAAEKDGQSFHSNSVLDSKLRPTSIDEDSNGEIYVSFMTGEVKKLYYD